MRNKLFLFIVATLLLVGGIAYAGTGVVSSDHVRILRSPAGGNTAFCDAILVNVGSSDAIAVGDVLVWNVDPKEADGFKVLKAAYDSDTIPATAWAPFAGVALEVTSADTTSTNANSTKIGNTSAVYMAIRGFCQAKIDASASVRGHALILNGATLAGSFATMAPGTLSALSEDIGVLLDEDNAVDGVYNVWLN